MGSESYIGCPIFQRVQWACKLQLQAHIFGCMELIFGDLMEQ